MAESYRVEMTRRVFYIRLPDGSKAYLKYMVDGNRLKLIETYTPPKYRGRGLARVLTEYALKHAMEKGLYVEPICSYSVYYFIKHSDKRNLLAPEYREVDLEELFRRRIEEEKNKG